MRTIRNDTQGAVMVLAIFMAMIVIGFLYYLVGLGDAILAQERMQDAADATAFSSAVIHARGMNVLALMNIIMASLMAILVLLSMISSLLMVAAAALLAIGFFVPPVLAGVPPLRTQAAAVSNVERKLAPKVNNLVGIIHKFQKPLSRVIPMLASVNAMKLARESYSPVVEYGLTFPILSGLPTVEGKFETLCTKAGEYAGLIASFPVRKILSSIPSVAAKRVEGFLVDSAKDLGGKYARFYCGIGEKPPAPSFRTERGVPELGSTAQRICESKVKENETDAERAHRDKGCAEYGREMKSIVNGFDFVKGECTAEGKDNLNCLKMIRKARKDCNPNEHSGRSNYQWREATITRHYELRGSGEKRYVHELKIDEKNIGEKRERKRVGFVSGAVMCRIGRENPWVENEYGAWNTDVNEPVCTTEIKVPTKVQMIRDGETRVSETHKAITHVLHCAQSERIKAELADGSFKELKKQKPQEMCNCATQGESMFQVRSVVVGDPKAYTADSDKRILVATGGAEARQSSLATFGDLAGRLAIAQAEYFFDDEKKPRSEWLWHMNWKARMRRFHIREDSECKVKENSCPGEGKGAKGQALRARVEKLLEKGTESIVSH